MQEQVQIQSYNGALLLTQLFSSSQTILLGNFGTMTTRTLTDDSGQIHVGESVQIGASSYVLIGSGTAQPGVSLLGAIIPTGTKVDLLVFSGLNGQLFFVYPDGAPNLLGAVALVVTLSPIGYNLGTGMILCFMAGTMIRTTAGWRAVQELRVGQTLPDRHGAKRRIFWTGLTQRRQQNRPPVMIRRNSFGRGVPAHDTVLSAWHRIPLPSLGALAPAAAFTRCQGIEDRPDLSMATFHHILLDRHALIDAQGMWAESFLPRPTALAHLSAPVRHDLTQALGTQTAQDYRPCAPLLGMRAAREALYEAGWTVALRHAG
jgi:hypothetical protein